MQLGFDNALTTAISFFNCVKGLLYVTIKRL